MKNWRSTNNSLRSELILAFLVLSFQLLKPAHAIEPLKKTAINVPEGFSIKVAAVPPLVTYPMMACLDDKGRLYVAESDGRNLTTKKEIEKELPRIISRLVDTNDDGVYDESTIYFIFIKKQIYLYTTFKLKKEILKKINLCNIEKIFELQNFDFFKYPNFFSKNISPEEKKNIILEVYNLNLRKSRKYVFLIFWIIENDINHNILDNNLDEFEDYKIIDKISDIFLEEELLEVKIQEID